MPTKTQKNEISFPAAIRSFVGYLEGSKKSLHTIKNYQLDILAFQDFIYQEYSGKLIKPFELNKLDLTRYRQFLQKKGFKTNTRRRKILTVTQFLNYLGKRNKIAPELTGKFPAPHKIERIPYTLSSQTLLDLIQKLPQESLIEARNRALLWTLAETGCLVSEVTELRFDQWSQPSDQLTQLEILGKIPRVIPVTADLFNAIRGLQKAPKQNPWIFSGFNKFGSLGSPISPRGVELLVKAYGAKFGYKELTPRTFRHSIILQWFSDGLSQKEIQNRLGLKTTYAFRSYETLIKKPADNFA